MTSRSQVKEWYDTGVEKGYTYVVVVCDCFDYEDFPVYCTNSRQMRQKVDYYNRMELHRVMDVLDLSKDFE